MPSGEIAGAPTRFSCHMVSGVSGAGADCRLTCIAAPGARPADAVQDRLAELACHVRSFQVEGGRLDEVFRTLTTASAGEVHRT